MPVSLKARRLAALLLAGLSAAAFAEPSFVPVYRNNFPDPHVVLHGGEFVAYATNDGINLPMLVSRDLVNWSPVADQAGRRIDGMPALAPWVQEGRTWAPEVMKVGAKWLLYYTAHSRRRKMQCLGVASADHPKGPFRDQSTEPLVCQYDQGGTIDANPFRDSDGKLYVYYKSDGNAVGKTTYIWGQRLSDDGLKVVGAAVPLIKDDAKWEWRLVEAPSMVRSPAGHQLFYSAAFYGWDPKERLSRYATGYATCAGPLGPCQDAPENPILNSFNERQAGCLSGPGHPGIFQVGARTFMAFHAWAATSGCRKADDKRYLYIAPLFWKDGKPLLAPSLRQRARAR
ncbi:glycoside hydrolase family 43 protein [Sphingomonas sp.]|uniref:glycoside hydrolase family 43 protein n=1 Tax=Sphingomonas sp. TaxID=28214 RepID=UPI0017B161C8|nr:glycoside hydrolase family 43 protein [Sphingomonas sp.]MBA3512057.1 family 43 glycosylhydrolase [Sphingomonas sp.]